MAVVALIPPGAILVTGIQQLLFAMGGGYMSDVAAVIAPILIALGLMLAAPAVLYLILRRRFLFVVAVVVAATIPLMLLL
ncbi:MAG: hypothetical protein GX596_03845 [Propionibacterium sp.]|nr:hypothetical protein [Propionibacterium sp.]